MKIIILFKTWNVWFSHSSDYILKSSPSNQWRNKDISPKETTSGFLLFFPAEDVIELDMSVEDAAKLVISAGLVYPEDLPVTEIKA